nr:MAG TPA: hypothetical protein [Caudoviricetes sp.]
MNISLLHLIINLILVYYIIFKVRIILIGIKEEY